MFGTIDADIDQLGGIDTVVSLTDGLRNDNS